jgi:RNA polymerase sigma-70 factor, ECF subfamily
LDHAAVIQRLSADVQSSMTVAFANFSPIATPRMRGGGWPRFREIRRAASGASMTHDRTAKRGDPWSERIVDIAEREDRAAFAGLFAHFAPRVKAYLMKGGTSEPQAEDLAQETLLSVWRKARLFDPSSAGAATWIFTIARNLRIDAVRRERRGGAIRVDEVEAEFEADDAPGAEVRLIGAEAEARVRQAMKTLPRDQLRVIELSFFEERPHGEIARALQIPLGTVKSRVRLAMNRLRGLLDEFQ